MALTKPHPTGMGAGSNVQLTRSRNEQLVLQRVQTTQYHCMSSFKDDNNTQSIFAFIYLSIVSMSHNIVSTTSVA